MYDDDDDDGVGAVVVVSDASTTFLFPFFVALDLQMNLALFDHEFARATARGLPLRPASSSTDLCKEELFPSRSVCPLCYRKKRRKEATAMETEEDEDVDDDDWRFRSTKVILRYLYAVYTRDKIL